MTIVAGGDSFTYGLELADCANSPSKKTFPALLSGNDYECVAWGGYGNDSIARTVVERCERSAVDGVIVCWSFPGRYEFRYSYNTGQRTSPWHVINSWTIVDNIDEIRKEFVTENHTILSQEKDHLERASKTGIKDFAKTFFHHVGGTEYWEIYSSLKEIVYLQNYLDLKRLPYIFTCVDNSIFENFTVKESRDPFIKSLISQIDIDKWFLFPPGDKNGQTLTPRGFYQWAKENKYRIGTTHPLEEAHQDAANLMQGRFNELVKKISKSH
jgi:hypothetical protein